MRLEQVYLSLIFLLLRGSAIPGFVDDYAWIVRSFLYLYEATLDTCWLEFAEELQDKQNELFWDSEGAGYYMTEKGDESILLRIKEGLSTFFLLLCSDGLVLGIFFFFFFPIFINFSIFLITSVKEAVFSLDFLW